MTTMIEMAKRHRDADMLIAGTYGEETPDGFKGCSVGCFAHELGLKNNDHAGVAAAFGIPEWAVLLQDAMFEGLPKEARADWHVDYAEACSGVTDWADALHRVHIAILNVALETAGEATLQVQAVIDLHKAREPKESAAWSAAESAAESAAGSAAWSAAESAAWSAAWSAVYKKQRDAILAALREVAS